MHVRILGRPDAESVRLEELSTRCEQHYELETECWLCIPVPYMYHYLVGRRISAG
jgi:hypothetical protein